MDNTESMSTKEDFNKAFRRLKDIYQNIKEPEVSVDEALALLEESITLFQVLNDRVEEPVIIESDPGDA